MDLAASPPARCWSLGGPRLVQKGNIAGAPIPVVHAAAELHAPAPLVVDEQRLVPTGFPARTGPYVGPYFSVAP